MPRFSVIIPVYNVAPYLRECLDSLSTAAERLRGGVEIIAVDDGSTDGSAAILDEYTSNLKPQTSNFKLQTLHQPNAGVSAARNAALEVAQGEYICFVDGDDAVAEEYFTLLSLAIAESGADIVRFDHQPLTKAGAVGAGRTFDGGRKTKVAGRVADQCLSSEGESPVLAERLVPADFRSFVGATIAWNACYRRAALGGLKFEPIPNGEDVLFAAEAFMRAKSAVSTGAKIYRYRHREGSAVNTVSMRHFASKCEMCRLLKARIIHPGLGRNLRNHLGGEILPMLAKLPREERAAGWRLFFDTLGDCAWNRLAALIARWRSRFLARLVLGGEIAVRRLVARLRRRADLGAGARQ